MATRKEKLRMLNHMGLTINQLEINLYDKVCAKCNPFVVNFELIDFLNESLVLNVLIFSVGTGYAFESVKVGFNWDNVNWSWKANTNDYVNFDVVLEDYARNCDCI